MKATSVLDILEETAARYPDKAAFIDDRETYTYGQLMDNARSFGSGLLQALCGETHRPVMLFMDKSVKCVAAMLGTLYSGNFYVPMDVKTPIERLNSILETLGNAFVITTAEELTLLQKAGYTGEAAIYEELVEVGQEHDSREALSSIRSGIVDTDLMYVLFTSGSTGVPKGVAVMHRSVVDYIDAFIREVPVDENDIFGNQAPFYADMSLKDIYMSIKTGATVCIIPQKLFMSPKKLLQFLDDRNVTALMWVPTAYRLISQFDALSKVRPRNLRKFLFSGEAMPISVYRYWIQLYPVAVWIQQYGPTEITGACTSFRLPRVYEEGETIPIGKPFPNTGILLLDEEDEEIAKSDTEHTGEICVYGSCLAAGYYNNPEKTKEVFVQNPAVKGYPSLMYRTGDLAKYDADGNLVFISRKDYQIKHAGKRVELGEIEAAAMSIPALKACCCVQNRSKDALCLYYIGEISDREIIEGLSSRLPKYMIPTVYHKQEELPTLPNGKLSRKQIDGWANESSNE